MSVYLVSKEFADEQSLMHYRTKGSKNGIRRFQNEDGSLTPEGREHYGVGEGKKSRGDIESETEKDRNKREKSIDRTAKKIEKKAVKVEKYEQKSHKYGKKAVERLGIVSSFVSGGELASQRKYLNEHGRMRQAGFLKRMAMHKAERSLSCYFKSQKFLRKANRGQKKLERLRARLESMLPEDQKEELKHAGISDDFFAMFDTLSDKQKQALYVLFDDVLDDE